MTRKSQILLLVLAGLNWQSAAGQDDELDQLLGESTEEVAQPKEDSASSGTSATVQSDEAADPKPKPRGSRLIEEIVVTAQKREEDLSDVPISVQAFSGEMLDARGIDDQTSLQQITPGLTVSNQVAYVVTYLRGIGTDAFITADPSVATYIDGVYFPFAQGLTQNFGGVERIEVLKGPQGTLFGRNATGGAINIVSKAPMLDEFSGDVLVSYGTFDDRQTRGTVNIPLGEKAAFLISAFENESDNYYEGTVNNGEPLPKDQSEGLRLKALFQPVDDLAISLAYTEQEVHGFGGSGLACNTEVSALGELLGIEPQEGYRCSNDAAVDFNLDLSVTYGEIAYNAPWFDTKLIASDQQVQVGPSLRDFDGSELPLAYFAGPKNFLDAQSAELQFLSNGDWGPDWLEWIVGAYYYKGDGGYDPLQLGVGGVDLGEGTIAGIELPLGLVDLLNLGAGLPVPGLPLPSLPLPTGVINTIGTVGTESSAVFVQGTITFSDWLSLTLGARYQAELREILRSRVAFENVDGSQTELMNNDNNAVDSDGNPVPPEFTTRDFSPKVSVQLRPFDEDTLIFLSYQEAVKAATYNAISISEQPTFVEPEEVKAWELGLKTTIFDGLGSFNAALFQYDLTNLQTQFVSLFEGGAIAFENVPEAESWGGEFDTTLQIFPQWTPDLILAVGLAYLDAEYISFPNASGFSEEDGSFSDDNDFSGNRIVRTPEYSGTLALSKTWQMTRGALELTGDVYYADKVFYEASNREASSQEAYALYGARLSYLHEPWNLRTTIYGRNLTDELYAQGIFVTDFGVQPSYARPRTYGIKLSWEF